MVRISIANALTKDPEQVVRMQKEMLDNVAAILGVTAAGFARYIHASPGLLAAQGSRLLAGRDFTWDDVFGQHRVAIASENIARDLGRTARSDQEADWDRTAVVSRELRSSRGRPYTSSCEAGTGSACPSLYTESLRPYYDRAHPTP